MSRRSTESPVRIIGSRELHQKLKHVLKELEGDEVRYVLTVHGKPRAVLVGANAYLEMIQHNPRPSEALVGLQLSALLGGDPPEIALHRLEEGRPADKLADEAESSSTSRTRSSNNHKTNSNHAAKPRRRR